MFIKMLKIQNQNQNLTLYNLRTLMLNIKGINL